MNFIEAVKEIRKGTMVRRKSFPDMDIFKETHTLGHILIKGLHSEHIEATDWEIVDDETKYYCGVDVANGKETTVKAHFENDVMIIDEIGQREIVPDEDWNL